MILFFILRFGQLFQLNFLLIFQNSTESGEDPNNHVMTFHLWCSSNSLMDDSIRLRLFQRTLTGSAAKWYIELPRASFHDFNSLAMSFLTHFQLPIRYETGTELLTSLRQTTPYISLIIFMNGDDDEG
jgi:hypothetical protein